MKITEIQPLLVNALPSMNDEDIAHVIRQTRLYLLQQSDWTQLPDSPLSEAKRAEWATYRQALRDITDTYADNLLEAEFPTSPSDTLPSQ
jgi:hypothetical protein